MRHPTHPALALLCVLVSACDTTAPTVPDAASPHASFSVIDPEEAPCTVALHAVLREAGSTAVVGQIQFRIDPPAAGDDPTVEYRGVYAPTGDLTFGTLRVELTGRIPDHVPSWSDVDKSDPGTTLSSVLHFGRTAVMSRATALALVESPASFRAVVDVVGSSGGKEAEGLVEPDREVPESLRDRQRICFGGG